MSSEKHFRRIGSCVWGRPLLVLYMFFFSLGIVHATEYALFENDDKALSAPLSDAVNIPFAGSAKRGRQAFLNTSVSTKDILKKGDVIRLDLFIGKTYTGSVDRIVKNVNGTMTVRARVDGYPLGHFLISTTVGKSLASIQIPEKKENYLITSGSDGNHYLLEMDSLKTDVLEGGASLIPPKQLPGELETQRNTQMVASATLGPLDPVTVDVLIVYTPAALTHAGGATGIANVIAQAMEKAQLALDNSATYISFNLVHSAEVDYAESGDSETDLKRLTSTTDGYMDIVHGLRNTYSADIVTLFADVNDVNGLAWLMNSASGMPTKAFNLTRVQSAGTSLSYIHEMGHNMGLGHHKDQLMQPGPGLYSYSAGWRWVGADGYRYCSVMTYEDGSFFPDGRTHTSVPHFSNPSLNYSSVATGHASNGDNARTLRETKHVVAAYRSEITTAPNNAFASGSVLNGISGEVLENNSLATKETGEPNHAGNPGGKSLWWHWTAPASGQVTINTLYSGFDTVLAAYTGSAVGSLTEVTSNDDANDEGGSQISFTASAGTTYRIAVDGFNGASGNILLIWKLMLPGPANDYFDNATSISGLAGRATGGNLEATKEDGEPDHAFETGGKSVWWSWTAPSSGLVTIDTFGSTFDTVLAAYTGDTVSSLTETDSNDDANGVYQSQIMFIADEGTTYHIAVDGLEADSGTIILNWRLGGPANDQFASATIVGTYESDIITGSNVGATKEAGEPTHAGVPGGKSVWWRWTAPASGLLTIDTYDSDFDTILAAYTGYSLSMLKEIASNNDCDDWWAVGESRINFYVVAGTTYYLAVDGYDGASGMIVLNAFLDESVSPPVNDSFASASIIAPYQENELTGNNANATKEPGEPNHAENVGGKSLWWRWTAPATGLLTIDTTGSDFNIALAIYKGNAVNSLTEITSNMGGYGYVSFSVIAGTTYYIAVDGNDGDSGNVVLLGDLLVGGPANDGFANATLLSQNSGTVHGDTSSATAETGEAAHYGYGPYKSIWYKFTPATSGSLSVNTHGTNFDTVLAICKGLTLRSLDEVDANDDDGWEGGYSSGLSNLVLTGGSTYHIAIDGVSDSESGACTLNWAFTPRAAGTLQFSAPTLSVNENGGFATLTVTRTGGTFGPASVNFTTANGSARAGSDYTLSSGTLEWTDGVSDSQTFTVPILDDTMYESNETFTVSLSGATGATLGAPAMATLTIMEDDPVPTYTITYNANGATGGTVPSEQIKTYDVALTLASNSGILSRTGYTLLGWNTAWNGLGTDYTMGGRYTTNESATLYAKWSVNSYTVSLNQDGGAGGSSSVTVAYGSPMPAATAPTRAGHTFLGYFDATTGGTQYYTPAMASARAWDKAAAATLFARWLINTYSVTYDGNSATAGTAPSGQIKTYGVSLTLSGNTGNLARVGFTFSGWNTATNGTGTSYATNASYTGNAGLALYAKWIVNTYTVVYNGNGSTGGATANSAHTYNAPLALTANGYTRTGYSYIGWLTNALGDVIFTNRQTVLNLTTVQGATVTLHASWTGNVYKVTFDANGGVLGTSNVMATYGAPMPAASGASRTGYTFAGYFDAATAGTNYYTAAMASATNWNKTVATTLYAQWSVLQVTTTTVPVPFTWLDQYPALLSAHGGDYNTAADSIGANGYRVWESYAAGLNPMDPLDRFLADIVFSNGLKHITWSPDLGAGRKYTIEGKTNLNDSAWHSPTNSGSQFFKVKVEMP